MTTAREARAHSEPSPGARDGTRLLFLHIAKTAGMSFREQLGGFEGIDRLHEIPAGPGEFMHAILAARDARVIVGHVPYAVLETLGPDLQAVTFLREPVDRSMSIIDWIVDRPEHPAHRRVRALQGDVEALLLDPELQTQVRDVQTSWLGSRLDAAGVVSRYARGEISELEAWEEIWVPTGAPCFQLTLELAKSRLSEMPFFGITELYGPSVRLFSATFGLPEPVREERHNVAPRRDGRDSRYRARDRELLESVNLWDSALYEFGRELFVERYRRMFGEDPG